MKAPFSDDDEDNEVEDGADDDFKLDYAEWFSVLMYYYGMSKEDIMRRSRRFLYALYKQYVRRACENLGVSPDKEDEEKTGENAYPSQFKKLSKTERAEAHEKLAKRFEKGGGLMQMFDKMSVQGGERG